MQFSSSHFKQKLLLLIPIINIFPSAAFADFFADSTIDIDARNFYINRDFRNHSNPVQSKQEEWGQGFIVKAKSGFTETKVGLGADIIAGLGLKLDSSPDRSGTGLFPGGINDQASDNYSKLEGTFKAKYANTIMRYGILTPSLPILMSNDTRLLPQLFKGALFHSQDIKNLDLKLGYITQENLRDSSNFQNLGVAIGANRNINIRERNNADNFQFFSSNYKWNDAFKASYSYAKLESLYQQNFITFNNTISLAKKRKITSSIHYSLSSDKGNTNVDNRATGVMTNYTTGAQRFTLAFQKMTGDTGFAYITGTDPDLFNFVQVSDFANKDENSWQVRYDYDFAKIGISGLHFMSRYLKGSDIDTLDKNNGGREWERDTDINYTIQAGPLKNFGIDWKNAIRRSTFGADINDNRLILTYHFKLK